MAVVSLGLAHACGSGDGSSGGQPAASGAGGVGGTSVAGSGGFGTAGTGDAAGGAGGSGAGAGVAGAGAGAGGAPALPGCDAQEGPSFDMLAAPESVYTSPSLGGPKDITLHAGSLYLWDGDGIVRLDPGTLEAVVVTRVPGSSSSGGMTMNDSHVFVVVGDQLLRGPLDGTEAASEVVLAEVQSGIEYVAGADADRVYLANSHTGVLRAVPVSGGNAEETFTEPDAAQYWVEAGVIHYYQDTAFAGKLMRVPASGGTPELMVEASEVTSFLLLADDELYIGGQNGLQRTGLGTTRDSATPPELLLRSPDNYPSPGDLFSITAVGDRLYWVSDAPSVGWVTKDGGSCAEVLRLDNPFEAFVVTEDHVYFTFESDVYRVPRE